MVAHKTGRVVSAIKHPRIYKIHSDGKDVSWKGREQQQSSGTRALVLAVNQFKMAEIRCKPLANRFSDLYAPIVREHRDNRPMFLHTAINYGKNRAYILQIVDKLLI